MNKIKNSFSVFLIILFLPISLHSAQFVPHRQATGQVIFAGIIDRRQKQLDAIKQEKEEVVKANQELLPKFKIASDEVKNHIEQTQTELKKQPEDKFLKRKLAILLETYPIIKDMQREREQLVSLLDDIIKHLTDFLQDPNYINFKSERKLQEHISYSVDDLIKVHEQILDEEKHLSQLIDQEKLLNFEIENIKRVIATEKKSYRQMQDMLALTDEKLKQSKEEWGGLSGEQIRELTNAQETLFNYKKSLDELRLKINEYRLLLNSLRQYEDKEKRDILKQYVTTIKSLVRLSQKELTAAQKILVAQEQLFFQRKERARQEKDVLTALKRQKEEELESLAKQYNITLGRDIDDWSREPKKTPEAYMQFFAVSSLNSEVLLLAKRQELIEAQIILQEEKLRYERLQVQVKETFYKIIAKRFLTEDDIVQEMKKYTAAKIDTQADLTRYKEKITTIADQINTRKKVVDTIQEFRQKVLKEKEQLFKNDQANFNKSLEYLNNAQDFEKSHTDVLTKLTGAYSGITVNNGSILRLINFITSELESITIWHRPEYAISWNGLKNLIPDITTFFSDLRAYTIRFNVLIPINAFKNLISDKFELIIFLLKLVILFIVIIGIRFLLPYISRWLELLRARQGAMKLIKIISKGILLFISLNFWKIASWIMLWAFFNFQYEPDAYLYIIFNLLSIFLLLLFAHHFIKFMSKYISSADSSVVSASFSKRFGIVFSVLLYSTISIFFFRQAFIAARYYQSEVPTILLALNFIIFQISLILLLEKQQILALIPQKGNIWVALRTLIDNYYYLILAIIIGIIVMSNPYVGYGKLLLYVFFGLIYSILLLVGLVWFYGVVKTAISRLFFTSVDEQEIVKERFTYAKTGYGLVIMGLFACFLFLAFFIIIRIWGWQITVTDAFGWLDTPILGDVTAPISAMTILRIILFFICGLFIAWILNKYVLERIFDLFLVDTGVQYTVSRILQYLIVVAALFMGFSAVGLGGFLNYIIGALVLGLGWILKEPISDFVSYFIILVQRPVKIGDYIVIDPDDIQGEVRKITPRSIVLRRKNSYSIVVPNSYVTTRPIRNWNYTHNFIALDDITVIIDYQEDPVRVKHVLFTIIDSYPKILKNPKPIIRLESFGEYGFIFMVRGFVSSVFILDQWDMVSDVRLSIISALRQQGIKLALPLRISVKRDNSPFDK